MDKHDVLSVVSVGRQSDNARVSICVKSEAYISWSHRAQHSMTAFVC